MNNEHESEFITAISETENPTPTEIDERIRAELDYLRNQILIEMGKEDFQRLTLPEITEEIKTLQKKMNL